MAPLLVLVVRGLWIYGCILDIGCPQASDVDLGGQLLFAKSSSCIRLSYPVAEDNDASILKGIWLCTMVSATEGKSGNKSRRGDIISV